MANKPQYPPRPPKPDDDNGYNDCKDKDNATQVSITANRNEICKLLYGSTSNVSKAETKFEGENEIYKEKKCIFLNTEKSYRRYRNFEITVGTELLQTNVSLKAGITQIKDWNKALNTTLTTISKQVKELKVKFQELKEAACKLDNSYNDKCNITQKKSLTGKAPENCPDPPPPVDACKDAEKQIEDLICKPKGLVLDIDSIFQSSADVIGIQVFSNIDSLDQLHTDLTTKSSNFEKLINDAMKARKNEMEKLQEELINSVKIVTQAAVTRNTERAKFEGYYDAAEFLCCPKCDCINKDNDGHDHDHDRDDYSQKRDRDYKDGNKDRKDEKCPPRLKGCEDAICEICNEVKTTFCCNTDTPVKVPPTRKQPEGYQEAE
jgi:hypothetical protein